VHFVLNLALSGKDFACVMLRKGKRRGEAEVVAEFIVDPVMSKHR